MVDKDFIISDVIRDLHELNDPNYWKEYENRDEIINKLRFMASSLKNANINHVLLLKAIDAFLMGYPKLSYNILYSNNKLGTQEERIINVKFNNLETNFLGRLIIMYENLNK